MVQERMERLYERRRGEKKGIKWEEIIDIVQHKASLKLKCKAIQF